jgi:hypothetical protein
MPCNKFPGLVAFHTRPTTSYHRLEMHQAPHVAQRKEARGVAGLQMEYLKTHLRKRTMDAKIKSFPEGSWDRKE